MDPNEKQLRRSALSSPGGGWLSSSGMLVACGLALQAIAGSADSARLEFNRDIRPILSENCYLCHGPDKNTRKGKLRLDYRDEAVAKRALVPGKPEDSELMKRLVTADPEEVMPPPDTHKTISPAQRELLRRWIAEGAEYQPHWAYLTPVRPALPAVKQGEWVKKPIDAFILEALERRGIAPSPEADRATLLRRLSLDLIGLPPSPEEVAAFVKDRRSDAYARQVERFLRSPHFGERMAVGWLDLVRYADTVGYHGDQNINVFPYRDYVIRSFNENKPFDRFTVEQIAGDLLPNPTEEQTVATGFNRLNMVTREGGAQPKEYLAKYAADRVRTVAATWLGSTMGCAECHDHKFDPFTMKDFYSMAAFFADVKQWGVYQDYNYTPNPDLKGWSNDHPFPPEIEVDSPYLQQRAARIRSSLDAILDQVRDFAQGRAGRTAELESWVSDARRFLSAHPSGWSNEGITLLSSPKNVTLSSEGEVRVTGGRENQELVLALAPRESWVGAVRVELLPDEAKHIARGGGRLAVTVRVGLSRGTNAPQNLPVYFAEASDKDPRYANGYEILGIKDSWRTALAKADQAQTGVWVLETPVRLATGDRLRVTLKSDALSRVRVSASPFASADPLRSGADPGWDRLLKRQPSAWTGTTGHRLLESAMWAGVLGRAERARYRELHGELIECRGGKSPTAVTVAWKPTITRVLPRGNWQDESGDPLNPLPPQGLVGSAWSEARPMNRLDLARWLVGSDNPLTARVVMNRLWKQLFGNGISASVDDLGSQGEWPTHPALLDWLAVEFREGGWDLKAMVRTLVLSSTYRQSSNLRPELKDLDPNNRLLSSQNPRRLEAEFVRDNALQIAGLLQRDIGGPSVRPYQPAGYYAPLQFPDRDYQPQKDDRQYRRGLYMHWQRTFLHPMLANFDAPAREECTAMRTVSNTPQQALTLLNDPSFVEAARVLAQDLVTSLPAKARRGADPLAPNLDRLNTLFLRALGRPPTSAEAESLTRFAEQQFVYYQSSPAEASELLKVGFSPSIGGRDPAELAAWTSVCRVVLNLHETLTRY
jgi:hypothetical protein